MLKPVQVTISLNQNKLYTLLGHLKQSGVSVQSFFESAVDDAIAQYNVHLRKKKMEEEARSFKRVKLFEKLRAVIAHEDGRLHPEGSLLNISMGGMAIELEDTSSLRLRELVEVTLLLESESHSLDAMVLWILEEEHIVGLQFINQDYNSALFLLQLCEDIGEKYSRRVVLEE